MTGSGGILRDTADPQEAAGAKRGSCAKRDSRHGRVARMYRPALNRTVRVTAGFRYRRRRRQLGRAGARGVLSRARVRYERNLTGRRRSTLPRSGRENAGEVKDFDARDHLTHGEQRRMGRCSAMALAAARMAVARRRALAARSSPGRARRSCSGRRWARRRSSRSSTTSGSSEGSEAVSRALIPRYGSTLLPIHVARALGASGMVLTLPAACAAGNYAIGFASDLIRAGRADVVVTGAAELLQELQFSGFVRLAAMAPERCQPFDLNRQGLLLGEGAGLLVLESEAHAARRGARLQAEVRSYGLSCDAYHITRPHPDAVGQHRRDARRDRALGHRARRRRLRQRARNGDQAQRPRGGEGHARRLRRSAGARLEHEEHARALHGGGERARGDRLRLHDRDGHLPADDRLRDARPRVRRRRSSRTSRAAARATSSSTTRSRSAGTTPSRSSRGRASCRRSRPRRRRRRRDAARDHGLRRRVRARRRARGVPRRPIATEPRACAEPRASRRSTPRRTPRRAWPRCAASTPPSTSATRAFAASIGWRSCSSSPRVWRSTTRGSSETARGPRDGRVLAGARGHRRLERLRLARGDHRARSRRRARGRAVHQPVALPAHRLEQRRGVREHLGGPSRRQRERERRQLRRARRGGLRRRPPRPGARRRAPRGRRRGDERGAVSRLPQARRHGLGLEPSPTARASARARRSSRSSARGRRGRPLGAACSRRSSGTALRSRRPSARARSCTRRPVALEQAIAGALSDAGIAATGRRRRRLRACRGCGCSTRPSSSRSSGRSGRTRCVVAPKLVLGETLGAGGAMGMLAAIAHFQDAHALRRWRPPAATRSPRGCEGRFAQARASPWSPPSAITATRRRSSCARASR